MSEHPAHVYAVEVETGVYGEAIQRLCNTCGAMIVWGRTTKGRRAPFDYPKSPDGWVNHWVTCKTPPERQR